MRFRVKQVWPNPKRIYTWATTKLFKCRSTESRQTGNGIYGVLTSLAQMLTVSTLNFHNLYSRLESTIVQHSFILAYLEIF